jgi:protoporphyrinogen oxidase
MSIKDKRINIVGAGVSGLVAAIVLEKAGFYPHIFEQTDRVGGRVKTTTEDDFIFDHGFQVLLEAYPMAKKYLNYDALDLQPFMPGSVIFSNQQPHKFGDPLRNTNLLFPTLFSKQASLTDKFKVFLLNNELKKQSIEELFEKDETTTLDYLQKRGFSETIIRQFFQPFFSGIFLETGLQTSSRMFEFVFKLFGEGNASVPRAGIEAIPQQLKTQLKNTTFHFNVAVNKADTSGLTIEGLPLVESDYTIIATEASNLITNLNNQKVPWKSCYCFYFEVENKIINERLIGLIPGKHLINNLHYVNSLTGGNKNVLSVTVIDDNGLFEAELVKEVKKELQQLCGISVSKFLNVFKIPKALPQLHNIQYDLAATETQLLENVFLAGDVLLNGSLNAAMQAGERAAEAICSKFGVME